MTDKLQNSQIAIITNPLGEYNRRKGLDKFDALAKRAGILNIMASTPDEMVQAFKDLAERPPEIIVINGGDGSVDMALSLIRNQKILKKEPILALLKGGTTNLIHRDIGMRDAPHKALQKIINGNTQLIEHSPLEITYTEGEGAPLYGFFLGTGAIPRAILHTRKTLHKKEMKGPLSEVLMLAGLLARLRTKRDLSGDKILKPIPITWNEHQEDHIFLALSTLKKLIPGVRSPATNKHIGMIHMGENRKLKREKIRNITLQTQEPWVLDGEMHAAGKIDIKLGAPVQFMSERAGR